MCIAETPNCLAGLQRKQANTQRNILLRNALTTAQVLSTFVGIEPPLIASSEMLGTNVSEALRLLNSTDNVILRVRQLFMYVVKQTCVIVVRGEFSLAVCRC